MMTGLDAKICALKANSITSPSIVTVTVTVTMIISNWTVTNADSGVSCKMIFALYLALFTHRACSV